MRSWSRRMVGIAMSLCAMQAHGQTLTPAEADFIKPIAPFKIADNLYYVGSRGLASYLIVTPAGDILINSNMESSPAMIERNVEQLGFHFTDIRILLISHAHWDHDAGSAEVKRLTGAKYMVMDADVPVVESGGLKDFAYSKEPYPKAKVDRILHDGDQVRLGGIVLVAHKTPGHTRGCTTWTMRAMDHGKPVNVLIVGSWNVTPGFRLIDKPGKPASYPGISADYRRTFTVMKTLPCDIFLGAHGDYFNMLAKLERAKAGQQNVWIDPEGYRVALADREHAFETELHRQQAGGK